MTGRRSNLGFALAISTVVFFYSPFATAQIAPPDSVAEDVDDAPEVEPQNEAAFDLFDDAPDSDASDDDDPSREGIAQDAATEDEQQQSEADTSPDAQSGDAVTANDERAPNGQDPLSDLTGYDAEQRPAESTPAENSPAQAVIAPSDGDGSPASDSPAEAQAQVERGQGNEPASQEADALPAAQAVENGDRPAQPSTSPTENAEAVPALEPTDPARSGGASEQAGNAPVETQPAIAEGQGDTGEPSTEPAQAQTFPTGDDGAADAGQEAAAVKPEPSEPEIDPKEVLMTVATWSGAYGQAQERAVFRPFTEKYGYRLATKTYNGDYAALEAQGAEKSWSLVDLNGEALERACREGRLARLEESVIEAAPDGRSLAEDMLPGAVQPCGIASMAWSAVVVYDNRISAKPAAIADFFNTGKFPGKRLLPKQPRYSLELALMADGVGPDQVYATLKTQSGQDRAFRKLSSIKDDIVWWEKPSEVFERIADKEAVMGVGFNGRAFMAIVASKLPLGILWDRQIYTFDYWAIPSDAPHPKAAKDFIRFATSPQPLADQASWIPYGPSRRSALQRVGRQAELDIDMKPYLPTHEPNFAGALAFDGAFWSENEDRLRQRFADWVVGRQLPVQKEARALP